MSNLSGFVKRLRDIMRNDAGINGDAQRIEQIAWMLFLKVYDAKEQDWEWDDEGYVSIIPEECRWANWAHDDKSGKAMTGDDLLNSVCIHNGICHSEEFKESGNALRVFNYRAKAARGDNTDSDDNHKRYYHNDSLHEVGRTLSKESAEKCVKKHEYRTEYHHPDVRSSKELSKELTAGYEAA